MEGNRNVRQTYGDELRDWLQDQVASGKTRPGRAEPAEYGNYKGHADERLFPNYKCVKNIVITQT